MGHARRFWRVWVLGVLVVVTAGLFAYFVNFEKVLRDLWSADFRYLLAASVALMLCLMCYTVRWRLLLENKPSFMSTFHISNVGHGVNTVIPMRAGEVARITIMGGEKESRISYTEAASSYVVERMFEQMMRLVALGAAVMVGAREIVTGGAVLGVLLPLMGAFVILAWVYNHQKWVLEHGTHLLEKLPYVTERIARASIAGFLRNLNAVSSLNRLTAAFFWTFLTWTFGATYHYLLLVSMGDTFAGHDWLPVTLGSIAFSPPSATTQPIIFQGLIVAPLSLAGYSPDDLFTYAVLLNASQMFWMLMLGFWGLFRLHFTLSGLRRLLGTSEVQEIVRDPVHAQPGELEAASIMGDEQGSEQTADLMQEP